MKKMDPIKAEREQLNKELTQFFANNSHTTVEPDSNSNIPQILQAMSTLEMLRKNLSEEVRLCEISMFNIVGRTLTVKQQAQFHLEVSFQHRSVMNLKEMWNAFRNASQQFRTNITTQT